MKEILESYPRIEISLANGLSLLDTCFFIWAFEHRRENELKEISNLAMTSFNVQELLHVEHKLSHIKHPLRKFFKQTSFPIVSIPVDPGNRDEEIAFINSVDKDILKFCPDPSDGVLICTAIATKSTVFTRDKHHLFTSKLENFIRKYDIRIYKEIKDYALT